MGIRQAPRVLLLAIASAMLPNCGKLDVCFEADTLDVKSVTYLTCGKPNPLERRSDGLWETPEPINPCESYGPIVIETESKQHQFDTIYDDGIFDNAIFLRVVDRKTSSDNGPLLELEYAASCLPGNEACFFGLAVCNRQDLVPMIKAMDERRAEWQREMEVGNARADLDERDVID